jgi:hypothetical protein
MADKKISQLTASTTPLAGTEVLPVVQSGVTKQVSVDNLTAGKAVNGLTFTANGRATIRTASITDAPVPTGNNVGIGFSGGPSITPTDANGSIANGSVDLGRSDAKWKDAYLAGNVIIGTAGKGIDFTTSGTFAIGNAEKMRLTSTGLGVGTSAPENRLHVVGAPSTFTTVQVSSASSQYSPVVLFDGTVGAASDYILGAVNASWDSHTNTVASIRFESGVDTVNKDDGLISFYTSASGPTLVEQLRITPSGNINVNTGNLVIGTAGKGIDFSADGQAAGMTSELLDDYEEGTWTPTYAPTTGAFDAVTYNAATYGRYTKIGNTVVVLGLIVTDAFTVGTASGLLYIAGLPYTPATSASSAINYSTGFSTNNPNGGYTSSTRIYPTYKATANGNSANVLAGNLIDGAFKNYVIFQATYVV